ncbi:multidrug effflux MFS transporter [Azohydromonas australica]|uniref:multidrug effflux MFS transporter n=1 Tax=Azohydromonas australica TaxID=364039 RepID=UPI000402BD0F|nr:multidrug effflux MFS transporter [Azohydromonas australica]
MRPREQACSVQFRAPSKVIPARPADRDASDHVRHQTPVRGLWVLATLSALMAFASISTDLYLPAMPAMQAALHADAGTLELTVSGYLIGFSLGQLFWGPIGDRYGRRLPIAIGLVLFVIGSAGCALSRDAATMIGWRVVQASGACASVVLARAMVRDIFEGHRAAQMMSTLMTVMAIAPLVGPSAGGLILQVSSWPAIFWTLVGVGLVTLVAVYMLPETLPRNRRSQEALRHAVGRYAKLLQQRRLLGYAGVGGFFYAGMYAYVAGTPFAYIAYHHLSAQHYGLVFALGISGIMATNLLNARLVSKYGGDRLMAAGTVVASVAGVLVAIDARTEWGGMAGLVAPLFVFVAATGFIVANSITGALASFPAHAGSVSALIGAIQYGSGILGSALVGALADGTPWPMGGVIALSGLGSLLCVLILKPSSPAVQAAAQR